MMNRQKKINVGVGFVTGRKNFKNVANTYINNWNDEGEINGKKSSLHLFVAYDLKYKSTKASDYNITNEKLLDIVDSAYYLGDAMIKNEANYLVDKKIITRRESKLIFGEGYAMKRNAVLYFSIKHKMDYLIFLDDDEYPLANIRLGDNVFWRGQEVLSTHINNLKYCDMTHGHHCGYISPIPHFKFNNDFTENEFKIFIESISNDIIHWDSIKKVLEDDGVTYADPKIMNSENIKEVKEVNGMKFISGANLGFNLKNIKKIFPFYNPPGARGEDTFLSTCLSECNIQKVPSYTFHDGFSFYEHLIFGVLPNKLKAMLSNSTLNKKRFLKASIGWIRYKPLMLYITQRESYEADIEKIKQDLAKVLPSICKFFGDNEFQSILDELEYYHTHVVEHYKDFENTKLAWIKLLKFLNDDEYNAHLS